MTAGGRLESLMPLPYNPLIDMQLEAPFNR